MIKNSRWVLGGVFLTILGCTQARAEPPAGLQGVVELEERQLGFEFGGRLTQLWVRRGDQVEVGQRLAAIDDGLERAAAQARRSETEAARARARVLGAGSRPEEVRAIEARIRAANASIRQLAENLERERTLLAQGVTPRAVVAELSAELDRQSAERDALTQSSRLLVRGPRPEEVAALELQADATQALLDAQSQRVGRFELYAPIAGEVLDYHVEPGEIANAGAPVVTLGDTAHPYAEVFVPQGELGGIRLGAPIRVRVDALPEPLGGHVEHIARRMEFTPRFLFSERERPNLVVRVRVKIDDPERKLFAGLPARVEFEPLGDVVVSGGDAVPSGTSGAVGGR